MFPLFSNRKMNDSKFFVMHHLLERGETVSFVARELKCDRKTVAKWRKRAEPPSIKKKASRVSAAMRVRRALVRKLARTKVLQVRTRYTPVRKKPVSRTIVRFPYDSSSRISRALAERGITASPSTVRLDLIYLGFSSRRRGSAPYLSAEDKQSRVRFCKEWLANPFQIAFSDESNFDTNETLDSRYHWTLEGERPPPRNAEQGAASVTVWGCIAPNFKRLIIFPEDAGRLTIGKYRSRVLTEMLPHLRKLSRLKINFQQDNAPAHRGALAYLQSKGIKTLDWWPARSCDMNPIEQLWSHIKRQVANRGPFGAQMLSDFIREEWEKVPQSVINGYVESFHSKCKEVVRQKGECI